MKHSNNITTFSTDARARFRRGLTAGIPIALGYLSVSFGFGILAVRSGLTVWQAALISLTCVTSAGQVAGVGIIATGGTLLEMALVQFTINLRYALMSLSLSQKLDKKFTTPHRLLASYGITDEIFAVSAAEPVLLTPAFMYGLILISVTGWIMGTTLGAAAGEILPESISAALGILLYGMFIAIVIPPARKQKSILFAAVLASALSLIAHFFLPALSSGFTVILCTVIASAATALLFPVPEEEEKTSD